MRYSVEWSMSGGSWQMVTMSCDKIETAISIFKAIKREEACQQIIVKRDGIEIRVWRR